MNYDTQTVKMHVANLDFKIRGKNSLASLASQDRIIWAIESFRFALLGGHGGHLFDDVTYHRLIVTSSASQQHEKTKTNMIDLALIHNCTTTQFKNQQRYIGKYNQIATDLSNIIKNLLVNYIIWQNPL